MYGHQADQILYKIIKDMKVKKDKTCDDNLAYPKKEEEEGKLSNGYIN